MIITHKLFTSHQAGAAEWVLWLWVCLWLCRTSWVMFHRRLTGSFVVIPRCVRARPSDISQSRNSCELSDSRGSPWYFILGLRAGFGCNQLRWSTKRRNQCQGNLQPLGWRGSPGFSVLLSSQGCSTLHLCPLPLHPPPQAGAALGPVPTSPQEEESHRKTQDIFLIVFTAQQVEMCRKGGKKNNKKNPHNKPAGCTQLCCHSVKSCFS